MREWEKINVYLNVDFHICEEVSVETDSADLDIRTSEETTVQSDWMDNAAVLVTVSSSAFTVLSGIGSVEQDVVRQMCLLRGHHQQCF